MTSFRFSGSFASAAAWAMLASVSAQAADPVPPGALLRQGEWRGEIGTYHEPAAWQKLPVQRWPMDGWGVLVIDDMAATLSITPLSVAEAGRRLKPITEQLELVRRAPPSDIAQPNEPPAGTENEMYVRVPGLVWRAGTVPLHRFRNGTASLSPELGRRIELTLGGRAFAFTAQNGLRTPDGRPYGEGVQFTLEVDGQRYDYDLGGYGWDVRITALGDFDRDGRPDFVFSIGGPNAIHAALVLSSVAKPGRNPPTAYLTATGC
jgi:opacity protein-like surface antigen